MWQSIVWFLVIGGLFYLMMRGGGCGMHRHGGHEHRGHGHGGEGSAGAGATDTVRDPVCGMEIEASRAAGTTRHGDHAWHFCSVACQLKFLADPDSYTK